MELSFHPVCAEDSISTQEKGIRIQKGSLLGKWHSYLNSILRASGSENCVGYTWRISESTKDGTTKVLIILFLFDLASIVCLESSVRHSALAANYCFYSRLRHDLFTLSTLFRTLHMFFIAFLYLYIHRTFMSLTGSQKQLVRLYYLT